MQGITWFTRLGLWRISLFVLIFAWGCGARKNNEEKPVSDDNSHGSATPCAEAQDVLFAGGDGTAEDPYQICTIEQLQNVDKYLDFYFILMSDLDFSGYDQAFRRIGAANNLSFTGTFDGNGQVINNFKFPTVVQHATDTEQSWVGLFRAINGGVVKNLTLLNVHLIGRDYVGAIAGHLAPLGGRTALISNCTIQGKIEGRGQVGGVVGTLGGQQSWEGANPTIENVEVDIDITATGVDVGGIAGMMLAPSMIASSSTKGDIQGASNVGGLAGRTSLSPTIKDSSSTATVTATTSNDGALIGLEE